MAAADESDAATPAPCPPCRGTGQVLSLLGGVSTHAPCPWCEGTGMQIPGHDAQAARLAAVPSA